MQAVSLNLNPNMNQLEVIALRNLLGVSKLRWDRGNSLTPITHQESSPCTHNTPNKICQR